MTSSQPGMRTLPPPFSCENLTAITQGAEALVYKTTFLDVNTFVVVKYRPPKPYRHPTLDKRLTKQRLLAEARSLIRVKREGVNVPGVIGADWDAGWLVLEFIHGQTVRRVLDSWADGLGVNQGREYENKAREDSVLGLMRRVGEEVGKLHKLGVCHGDLTTSNLMLRTTEDATAPHDSALQGDVFLIDFGLTTSTIQDEDRAVDLYVLERAFAATHPTAEPLFEEVLRAYESSYKGGGAVLKRLKGVRLRGRKRSMLG